MLLLESARRRNERSVWEWVRKYLTEKGCKSMQELHPLDAYCISDIILAWANCNYMFPSPEYGDLGEGLWS